VKVVRLEGIHTKYPQSSDFNFNYKRVVGVIRKIQTLSSLINQEVFMIKDCLYDDEIDYSDLIDEYEDDEMLIDEEFEMSMCLKSWV
jgi:hypothetical protein